MGRVKPIARPVESTATLPGTPPACLAVRPALVARTGSPSPVSTSTGRCASPRAWRSGNPTSSDQVPTDIIWKPWRWKNSNAKGWLPLTASMVTARKLTARSAPASGLNAILSSDHMRKNVSRSRKGKATVNLLCQTVPLALCARRSPVTRAQLAGRGLRIVSLVGILRQVAQAVPNPQRSTFNHQPFLLNKLPPHGGRRAGVRCRPPTLNLQPPTYSCPPPQTSDLLH